MTAAQARRAEVVVDDDDADAYDLGGAGGKIAAPKVDLIDMNYNSSNDNGMDDDDEDADVYDLGGEGGRVKHVIALAVEDDDQEENASDDANGNLLPHVRHSSVVDDIPASKPAQSHRAPVMVMEADDNDEHDAQDGLMEIQPIDEPPPSSLADIHRGHTSEDEGNNANPGGYLTVNDCDDEDEDVDDEFGQVKKHLTNLAQSETHSAALALDINLDDAPDGFGFVDDDHLPTNQATDFGSQYGDNFEEPALSLFSSMAPTPADALSIHNSPDEGESGYLHLDTVPSDGEE
jgi:hypothetical protein